MNTPLDPRNLITEDAFSVAPELLGRPLARPWRRGGAMLVDLFFVVLLANTAAVLLGFAGAILLFRVSFRSRAGGFMRRSVRWIMRVVASFALFVFVIVLWDGATDDDDSIVSYGEPEDAREIQERVAEDLRSAGITVSGLEVADESSRGAAASTTTALDSLVVAYASALQEGQDSAAASLRTRLERVAGEGEIRRLSERIESLHDRNQALEEELEEAREPRGLLSFLGETADDLGLGLGWSGLYFTAFLVLWGGRTPGKKLFRIRVLRLDGQPIGWWVAFERFGGYAASVVTGLLGLAQIYWDRNRQTIHDKIAETVVACE